MFVDDETNKSLVVRYNIIEKIFSKALWFGMIETCLLISCPINLEQK